jgi:uncharacterized membrane protein
MNHATMAVAKAIVPAVRVQAALLTWYRSVMPSLLSFLFGGSLSRGGFEIVNEL